VLAKCSTSWALFKIFVFWGRVSLILPRLDWNSWSLCLHLLSTWDYRRDPPCLTDIGYSNCNYKGWFSGWG
jgi:hypothetical protein